MFYDDRNPIDGDIITVRGISLGDASVGATTTKIPLKC